MWAEDRKLPWVVPATFKYTLSNWNPTFSGFQQHVCSSIQSRLTARKDAQEFLEYMLEKLHEDLNRVNDKPYFTGVETNGKTESEIADEVGRFYYC